MLEAKEKKKKKKSNLRYFQSQFWTSNLAPVRSNVDKKDYASAGNRTRDNCLEGNYVNHYTTDASDNKR